MPAKGEDESTTKAGVAQGTIEITDKEKNQLLKTERRYHLCSNSEYMEDRKSLKFGYDQCDDWLGLVKNRWVD